MSTEQIIDCWQNGIEPYTMNNKEYECVFIPSVNALECYQCGKTLEQHDGKQNLFTI